MSVLHKVHLAPASRYSEDIDLVIIGDRPEEHISRAIKRVLKGVLGKPSDSVWDVVKLAVRNVGKFD
ncbi:MAG: nucleotidyl transferase AbiEii/AbiGii toxin family protein [Desulfuromonadaceae bacterium]